MTGKATESNEDEVADGASEEVLVTVPNILCAIRLGGAFALFALALNGQPLLLLGLFVVLAATDWIDGKLAVWLDQRSTFGARLDSTADGAMYAGVLFGGVWLKGEVLADEWIWIATALLSYAFSCALAVIKYRRMPSYHTRTAKIAWALMVAAVFGLFLDWSVWPLRIAMAAVTVANVDAIIITTRLPEWRANVRSFLDAG